MRFLQTFIPFLSASILGLIKVAYADGTVIHDESFIPDAILHVSSGETKQSCVPSKEILLVNGTSPGPELRFKEGKTVWIRVYNDVPNENLTMVSSPYNLCPQYLLTDVFVLPLLLSVVSDGRESDQRCILTC